MSFKDSGQRSEFSTGAHRDLQEGKGRMDLMPFLALMEVSKVYEEGAKKYSDNNWRKGIPLSRYADSGMRHMAKWMAGRRDEPHLHMAAWNLLCLIETEELIKQGLLPEELNDLPYNPLEIEDNPHDIPPLVVHEKEEVEKASPIDPDQFNYVVCRFKDEEKLPSFNDNPHNIPPLVVHEKEEEVEPPCPEPRPEYNFTLGNAERCDALDEVIKKYNDCVIKDMWGKALKEMNNEPPQR